MKRAIHFQGPDRVPLSMKDVFPLFMIPPMSWQPPAPYYPYLHPWLVRSRLWRSKRKLPKGWLKQTRVCMDEWGTVWNMSPIANQGETLKCALEDGWHLLDQLQVPDFKDWSRYKRFARWSRLFGGSRYRLAANENSIWERYRYLRGFQNAMTDLIDHPGEVKRLLQILLQWHMDTIDNFKKAGAHGFFVIDDWGTQDRTFISPAQFNEFFAPCYKKVAEHCHELGMDIGIHSCGNVRLIVPSLIEIGFDFLQLDAPNQCGIDWLSENAAGKIALLCSPDIQEVYCKNDPVLLEAHIKDQIKKLARPNGGYVAWPYLEWGVIGVTRKTKNLAHDLFLKYGKYPINLE